MGIYRLTAWDPGTRRDIRKHRSDSTLIWCHPQEGGYPLGDLNGYQGPQTFSFLRDCECPNDRLHADGRGGAQYGSPSASSSHVGEASTHCWHSGEWRILGHQCFEAPWARNSYKSCDLPDSDRGLFPVWSCTQKGCGLVPTESAFGDLSSLPGVGRGNLDSGWKLD